MRNFLIVIVATLVISCNSGGSNSSSSDSSTDIKPVQNVNGNVPDTTNSGPINGSKKDSVKVDSSRKDSARH